MGALCPTGKNEVVVTNRVRGSDSNGRKEESSTTRIPDKQSSSSKQREVDKVSSREKALKELRHKQYADVISKFNRETLDVSRQMMNYDASDEDFLTAKYATILENVSVNLDIFQDVKIDEDSTNVVAVKTSNVQITKSDAVVPFLPVHPKSMS
eukprot:g2771.t1